ncbi:pirin-like protein [Panicum miliaceum]|uniref:Pirin-like protein n=1 Tax=Panicum miliaceum TaxID=4540 RepID=A0A3L6T8I1_PANMI|nr:pirin-like protein [Panicum miliaceum]
MEKPLQVVRKFMVRPQHEGVGAVVRRNIGRFELRYFDLFLVLDEFSISAPAGFPDHPHNGGFTTARRGSGEQARAASTNRGGGSRGVARLRRIHGCAQGLWQAGEVGKPGVVGGLRRRVGSGGLRNGRIRADNGGLRGGRMQSRAFAGGLRRPWAGKLRAGLGRASPSSGRTSSSPAQSREPGSAAAVGGVGGCGAKRQEGLATADGRSGGLLYDGMARSRGGGGHGANGWGRGRLRIWRGLPLRLIADDTRRSQAKGWQREPLMRRAPGVVALPRREGTLKTDGTMIA